MYYIVVTWIDGEKEIIDESDDLREAQNYRDEYRLAYNRDSYRNLTVRPEKSLQRTTDGRELIKWWEG